METYKQEIKDETRNIIWKHAINSLTNNRRHIRVLNPDYMEHLWAYSKTQLREYYGDRAHIFNEDIFKDWTEFADTTYQRKKVTELKVAFLCGPEPENDVQHLIDLGIRVENIYAFEYDKSIFQQAVNHLHFTYPRLKIINGKIEDFVELNTVIFDIVYLDFTRSLLNEYKTIFKLIDSNVLSELSILVVNTTIPDKTSKNISILANYFFYTPTFEYGILQENDNTEEDTYGSFSDGCSAFGIDTPEELEPYIERNFENAYSAFQTNFIILYSNLIKPVNSVVNSDFLFKRAFKPEKVNDLLNDKEKIFNWEFYQSESCNPGVHQIIKSAFPDEHFFNVADKGCKYTRLQSAYLFDVFQSAEYGKFYHVFSNVLQNAIPKIYNNTIGAMDGLFCDVPMVHLWLELIINQYGSPYHFNMENHLRYKYRSKSRDMYFDVFTFDRCRALYDWLPMIEYYGEDLLNIERQIVSRMCMDAIVKHSIYNLHQLYYGSNLVGIYEEDWSDNHYVPIRRTLLDNNIDTLK